MYLWVLYLMGVGIGRKTHPRVYEGLVPAKVREGCGYEALLMATQWVPTISKYIHYMCKDLLSLEGVNRHVKTKLNYTVKTLHNTAAPKAALPCPITAALRAALPLHLTSSSSQFKIYLRENRSSKLLSSLG